MKKIVKFLLFTIIFTFLFTYNVNATCNDKDLTDWALTTDVEFNLYTHDDDSEYEELSITYFFSLKNDRDDVYFVVTDGNGEKAKSSYLEEAKKKAVGCYINLSEETYEINIYGAENSKCSNQLLRTIKYTVPPYNEYSSFEYCKENPEYEMCATFKDTKDVSLDEYNEKMETYINEKNNANKIDVKNILIYVLCVIIPFAVFSIVYFIIKRKYIKKESEK